MRRAFALLAVVGLLVSGCAHGRPAATATTSAASPSASAVMICEPEAVSEIATAIGVQPLQTPVPGGAGSDYRCTYTYPQGKMVLSVRELADDPATTAFFLSQQKTLPGTRQIDVLGQPALTATDGTIVVRKDFKVLTVDVRALPAIFGEPPQPKGDIAFTVAAVIMNCWTGN